MAKRLKILFVCSKNKWRSPTAETVYRNHPLLEVRSGGSSPRARRTITSHDLEWADLVLVMEHKHKERLRQQHPEQNRNSHFHVLDIEDRYHAMDPRLIKELEEAIDPIIKDALSS